jgi:hypothetical protein
MTWDQRKQMALRGYSRWFVRSKGEDERAERYRGQPWDFIVHRGRW